MKGGQNSLQGFEKAISKGKWPERQQTRKSQLTTLRKCLGPGAGSGKPARVWWTLRRGDRTETPGCPKELRIYKTKYWRGKKCTERPLGRFVEIAPEIFS